MWQANQRLIGIAIAVAIHIAAIWGLLQLGVVQRPLIETGPIMVRFINPPPVTIPPITITPKPTVQPTPKPIPTPVRRNTVEPPSQLIAKVSEVPVPHEALAIPKRPEPIAVETEAPKAPVAPTSSTPIALPQFNAAYLENPPPNYPPQSKRRHEEGTVLLRVYVSALGTAEKVELNTSSGWPRLDQAAKDTVRDWRFVPANQGGKSVAAWVNVPINFSLEE